MAGFFASKQRKIMLTQELTEYNNNIIGPFELDRREQKENEGPFLHIKRPGSKKPKASKKIKWPILLRRKRNSLFNY